MGDSSCKLSTQEGDAIGPVGRDPLLLKSLSLVIVLAASSLAHFLSKYCAEWLTFRIPTRRNLAGAASHIYDTNHYLLGLKLELMASPGQTNKKGREFNPDTFLATI